MALPDSLTLSSGTAIVWADSTDYSTSHGLPSRTHQIDLKSIADGDYRQGAKADLGASRAPAYRAQLAIEWSSAPTAGQAVKVWFGWSESGTAGSDNPGNLSGADADYDGYGAASTDADEAVHQLEKTPRSLSCTADADVQIAELGVVFPAGRYVSPVVGNDSGAAFDGDAIQHALILTPIDHDIED